MTIQGKRRRVARWFAPLAAALALLVPLATAGAAYASVLFTDDFEGGSVANWARNGGSWSVVSAGGRVLRQSSTSSTARALAGTASWRDYSVRADVKPLAFNGTNRYAALTARSADPNNYYYLAVRNNNTAELGKVVGGSAVALGSVPLTVATGTWYQLRLNVFGGTVAGYVGGAAVASVRDATFGSGRIGLTTYNTAAEFDNVVVDSAAGPTPSSPTPSSPSPSSPTPSSPTPTGSVPPTPTDAPIGFAATPAYGVATTTGGAGGPVVTVRTAADFIDYATRSGPLVIRVDGIISLGAMQNVASDKTIIGVGANSGFTGYGLNVGLPVDNAVTAPPANAVHNVIIRNLSITHSADDAINVQMYSHHIWIDHNDLCCGYDGLVDIKRGSSYVTVSWNHTHDHTKNMLLGHDDSNAAQDVGYLKVTYHHNFFDRTPQRNPRVRFGEPVHVFNNVGSSRVDLQACKLEYSIVSPK